MDRLKNFMQWYQYTAYPLGLIILGIIIFKLFSLGFNTSACFLFKTRCEYTIFADQALTDYMGDLLASNPGVDIVTRKKN